MADKASKDGMSPSQRTAHTILKPYHWKPGQSGNPAGRPKGTGKTQKAIQAEIDKAVEKLQEAKELQLSHGAKKRLSDNGGRITSEIMLIALAPTLPGKEPSQAKIKCLLACFDRIIPTLKVVSIEPDGTQKRASELTDEEIVAMMERMVSLAQGTPQGELQ